MIEKHTYLITDFSNLADHRWQIVNDGVMGGLSQSYFQIQANGHGVFLGTVSLENNGGFASAKNVQSLNLAGYQKLVLNIMGDGKRYSFRFRTGEGQELNEWVYEQRFETMKNTSTAIELPLTRFTAVRRGKNIPGAPPPDLAAIREYGFLISDGQEGNFRLEIASIKAEG